MISMLNQLFVILMISMLNQLFVNADGCFEILSQRYMNHI